MKNCAFKMQNLAIKLKDSLSNIPGNHVVAVDCLCI